MVLQTDIFRKLTLGAPECCVVGSVQSGMEAVSLEQS